MQTKNLFNKSLTVTSLAVFGVFVVGSSFTFAQEQWTTYLAASACVVEPTVHVPYDINFGQFNYMDVANADKTNTWAVEIWWSATYTSDINGAWLFLAVEDPCATFERSANLLADDMADQNTLNTTTAGVIPKANVRMQYAGWALHLLNATASNTDVAAVAFADFIGLEETRTLLTRDTLDDQKWGIFGVQPNYELIIPQYQQADSYEGVIIWDIIVN